MGRTRLVASIAVLALIAPVIGPASGAIVGSSDTPPNAARVVDVLELTYLPPAADGLHLDRSAMVDRQGPATVSGARKTVRGLSDDLTDILTRATRYRGYQNPGAAPYLSFVRRVAIETLGAQPLRVLNGSCPNAGHEDPCALQNDYRTMMLTIDICRYVRDLGIDEVWIWGYHHKVAGLQESLMSGPNGDISNSFRNANLPECGRTYRAYHFNFNRGSGEALHNHAHQIEAEIDFLSQNQLGSTQLFRTEFEGWPYGGPFPWDTKASHGCGTAHNPPNARWEYDHVNPAGIQSDCMDWKPDGTGTSTPVSCATWGSCNTTGPDWDDRNWLIWWMQNLPGLGNTLQYHGQWLSNWWEIYADFDAAIASGHAILTATPPTSRDASLRIFTINGVDARTPGRLITAPATGTGNAVVVVPTDDSATVSEVRTALAGGATLVKEMVTSRDGGTVMEYWAVLNPSTASEAAKVESSQRRINVLDLGFFPAAAGTGLLDPAETGLTLDVLEAQRLRAQASSDLVGALNRATRFRGYAQNKASNYLTFSIAKRVDVMAAVPSATTSGCSGACSTQFDFAAALQAADICTQVQRGVNQVWIWAYAKPGIILDRVALSSAYGDVSAGPRGDDLPDCGAPYTVFHFDYAYPVYGALFEVINQVQAEVEFLAEHELGTADLWSAFAGRTLESQALTDARCGTLWLPPNTRVKWRYDDPTAVQSNCLDWTPDGTGSKTPVSCENWGCSDRGTTDNPIYNYLIWLMQNMPGAGNTVKYKGKYLGNWWAILADFDASVASGAAILRDTPAPAAMVTPSPSVTPASTPKPRPTSAEKRTIRCVKGGLTKRVTAVKPVCPKGFKRK